MYYPGTNIKVERYMGMYRYGVVYRYKPALPKNISGKIHQGGFDTPRDVVAEVKRVKRLTHTLELIGVYRIDEGEVWEVEVVLAHEVNHEHE